MNSRIFALIQFAAIALVLTFVAGCESVRDIHDVGFNGELWDHSKTAAPNSSVRLFKPTDGDDVLVVYDERQGTGGAVRLRAFFLKANITRIEELERPRFVDARKAEGMKPIPVYTKIFTDRPPACYAVTAKDGRQFTIYENGIPSRPYQLPTYRSKFDGHVQHLLLAPLSVASGAAAVGGAAGYLWLKSGAPGLPR